MELIEVRLNGYKRFSRPTKLDLRGKIISIVGPNEAGKSSLLKSIEHLSLSRGFYANGINQEITRYSETEISDAQNIVEWVFKLSDDDREELSHITDGKKVQLFHWFKDVDGDNKFKVTPNIKRDIGQRSKISRSLKRLLNTKVFSEVVEENFMEGTPEEGSTETSKEMFIKLIKNISSRLSNSEAETLDKATLDLLKDINNQFNVLSEISEIPNSVIGISKQLNKLIEAETDRTPNQKVFDVLYEKFPKVLFFSEADRNLLPEYSLDGDVDEFPIALQNLADLAGLDLKKLQACLSERGEVQTLCRPANNRLSEIFIWSQAAFSVEFDISDSVLSIHINHDNQIVSLAERSDGLKYYIALVAFLNSKQAENPILLIDELEQHLHYDAQVDLMQMLTRQKLTSKVIYSTHSVGCLPEDLGMGIRTIEVVKDKDGRDNRSLVVNAFWKDNEPGLGSLLKAMGASFLAFLPLRYALLTEGPSDIIFLPTMLREANKLDYLGFQVVPGLSIASKDQIAILNQEAARVVYFVDSDEGGEALIKKIKSAGVNEDRIFKIDKKENVVIEDLLKLEIYNKALNDLLKRHNHDLRFVVEEFPDWNRAGYVEAKCKKNKIKLQKPQIAYSVLEYDGDILDSKRKKHLITLYQKIKDKLKLS